MVHDPNNTDGKEFCLNVVAGFAVLCSQISLHVDIKINDKKINSWEVQRRYIRH